MKSYFILAGLFLFYFVSCESQTEKKEYIKKNNLKIDSANAIKLGLDATTFFSVAYLQYNKLENKLYLLNEQTNLIRVFDLKNGKQIKKIKFNHDGPHKVGEVWGFYYHNPDSIFVYGKFLTTIFLTDENAEVKDKYDLSQHDNSPYYPLPIVHTLQRLFLLENKLYLTGNYASHLKKENNLNPFFEYDLIKKELKYLGTPPKKIAGAFWESIDKMYIDMVKPPVFVLSSNVSDSLFLYNVQTAETKRFLARSNYFSEKDIQPFSNSPDKKAKDYLERAKYHLEPPKYSAVLYDNVNKLFYRFVVYKHDFKKFMNGEPPKIGLIVLDEHFNKIGEFPITKEYDFSMSFIGPKGLYIANRKAYQTDDNHLRFDFFNIE